MATVNLGRIKPQWQGSYASETSYVIDDMVLYNNSAYICTAATQGNAPTDTNYWDLMTQGSDIPSQTGNSGKVLKTDGSTLSWGDGLPTGGTAGQTITTDGTTASWTTPVEGKLKKVSKYTYTTTQQSNPGAFVWTTGPTWTHTLDDSSNTLVLWGNYHVASRYNNSAMRVQYSTNGGSSWTVFAGPTRSGWGSSPLHANIYTGDAPFIPSFSWMDTLTPGVSSVQIRLQISPDSTSWVAFNTRDGNSGSSNATGGPSQLTIMEYAA